MGNWYKPQLGRQMLTRAFAADVPCRWVTADSVYGADYALRRCIERGGRGYVLAVTSRQRLGFKTVDSNTVERSMRPVALTRKNALFAGSDEGAENWAMLASLIETCKLHGINPHVYLTDVLTRLVNNWPNRRLGELLPWSWTSEAS
jgi:hypothetical protein